MTLNVVHMETGNFPNPYIVHHIIEHNSSLCDSVYQNNYSIGMLARTGKLDMYL